MNPSEFPLPAEALAALPELCRRYQVQELDVFGSAVTGQFDPARSDFDLLVTFDDALPGSRFKRYFGLLQELEALLGRHVDLVEAKCIRDPFFRKQVESERTRLFPKP